MTDSGPTSGGGPARPAPGGRSPREAATTPVTVAGRVLFVAAALAVAIVTARCSSVNTTVEPSPVKCEFGLNPASTSVPAGTSLVSFAVATDPECEWVPTTTTTWITQLTPARGQGPGTVQFRAATNTGPARTGTIAVADRTFTVSQSLGCTYTISPTSRSYGGTGVADSVAVTAPPGCAWTAQVSANALSWLAVVSGSSGSGNGSVGILIAPLFFGSRTGTITIAGQTFTVIQTA
jgi:hypothetical protein